MWHNKCDTCAFDSDTPFPHFLEWTHPFPLTYRQMTIVNPSNLLFKRSSNGQDCFICPEDCSTSYCCYACQATDAKHIQSTAWLIYHSKFMVIFWNKWPSISHTGRAKEGPMSSRQLLLLDFIGRWFGWQCCVRLNFEYFQLTRSL